MKRLQSGLIGELEMMVSEANTASQLGSGSVAVLGTPALVGLMEGAAIQALEGHLAEGQTTVGGRIDVRHLAPTPVGMNVRARAELQEVDGRRLVFHVEAWDAVERIGEAEHVRFVIDEARFTAQAQAKSAS
jgi:predicted thioesterase